MTAPKAVRATPEYQEEMARRRTAQINESRRRRRAKWRKQCLDHYGSSCACCGETFEPFLCVDHVNGDGAEHRRQVKGFDLCRWLVRQGFPDGFRILCWNCNSTLHIHGECKPGHVFGP